MSNLPCVVRDPPLPYSASLPEGNLSKLTEIVIEGKHENNSHDAGVTIALGCGREINLDSLTAVMPLIFDVDYCSNKATLKYFDPVGSACDPCQTDKMKEVKSADLTEWPSLQRDSGGFKVTLVAGASSLKVYVADRKFFGEVTPLPCNLDDVTHFFIKSERAAGALTIHTITFK